MITKIGVNTFNLLGLFKIPGNPLVEELAYYADKNYRAIGLIGRDIPDNQLCAFGWGRKVIEFS